MATLPKPFTKENKIGQMLDRLRELTGKSYSGYGYYKSPTGTHLVQPPEVEAEDYPSRLWGGTQSPLTDEEKENWDYPSKGEEVPPPDPPWDIGGKISGSGLGEALDQLLAFEPTPPPSSGEAGDGPPEVLYELRKPGFATGAMFPNQGFSRDFAPLIRHPLSIQGKAKLHGYVASADDDLITGGEEVNTLGGGARKKGSGQEDLLALPAVDPTGKVPIGTKGGRLAETQTRRFGRNDPEAVKEWQRFLTKFSLYDGPIDGSFGPDTTRATKLFQTLNNIRTDGVVGDQTRNARDAWTLAHPDVEEPKAPVPTPRERPYHNAPSQFDTPAYRDRRLTTAPPEAPPRRKPVMGPDADIPPRTPCKVP